MTDRSKLPPNWAEASFQEIYTLNYGKALPKSARTDGGCYPVLGSSGVVGSHTEFLVEGPAIIVGRKGAAGAVVYSKENCWPIDTTYFVKPAEGVDTAFAYYQLQSLHLVGLEKSTAIPGLSRDDAYALRIAIPPTREQHRIVAKIEELFSELDKGIEALTSARQQLDVYRQAVLDKAISGELLVSRGFCHDRFDDSVWRPISEVVSQLGQGWSPRCLNHPSASDEAWAVITTTAIQHGSFLERENKQLPEELEPRRHLTIAPGDILVTRAGPRKRVGVACLVRRCRTRLILCDKAYRLRVAEKTILPEWLELVLNSPSILQKVEEMKTGISDSGVNLTQDRFLALGVPVPSLRAQTETLGIVDVATTQVASMMGQIDASLTRVTALRQSILKQAFSGQLVAQDATDEPASELLARIRAEREQLEPKKKRNGKNGKKNVA